MMYVIMWFEVCYLIHVEKPEFCSALNGRIADDELFCHTAMKVPKERLGGVPLPFDRGDVPVEKNRVGVVKEQ